MANNNPIVDAPIAVADDGVFVTDFRMMLPYFSKCTFLLEVFALKKK